MNNDEPKKPMNKPLSPLEPTMPGPNGGTVKRCQGRKKDGSQCGKIPRVGFNVCGVHGAGYAKREAEGRAKPAGTPIVHGKFSKSKAVDVYALMAELKENNADLDDTDDAMRLLYALLNQMLTLYPGTREVEAQMATLLEHVPMSPDTYIDFVQALAKLDRFAQNIGNDASRLVSLSKVRAETIAKLAQVKALDEFVKLAKTMSEIVRTHVSPQTYDVITQKLETELFGPVGVTREQVESGSLLKN